MLNSFLIDQLKVRKCLTETNWVGGKG